MVSISLSSLSIIHSHSSQNYVHDSFMILKLYFSLVLQGNESSLPMEMCSNCKLYLFLSKRLNTSKDIYDFLFKFLVDADEIRRLGKRFRKLDLDNSGSLSVDEFMSLPELQQNPLVQRVIDIFDQDGNGEVDFKGIVKLTSMLRSSKIKFFISTNWLIFLSEFIQGVSQFSVKGDKESKLRFAFRIYDMDNDGAISNGELFQVHTELYSIT